MREDGQSYAVRLQSAAQAEISEIYDRIAEGGRVSLADRWYDGLRETFAALSLFPGRCAIARESRLFQSEIHIILYQFGSRTSIYRILFRIIEASDEAAMVSVLSVRHGARRPMTRAEAREIEQSESEN